MFHFMATKFASKTTAFNVEAKAPKARLDGPTFAEIGARARRALRENDGLDVSDFSHAERNKAFFGI